MKLGRSRRTPEFADSEMRIPQRKEDATGLKSSVGKVAESQPLRGMLVMLVSCALFLVFLALVTIAIHFIML